MIVLDSSFIIAYFNEDDAHHARAAEAWPQVKAGRWGPALLPEYVFLETVTVLAARCELAQAARAGAHLLEAAEIEFVSCSPFFASAFEEFRAQRAAKFSFADAATGVIARSRGAAFVATFDEDFRASPGLTVVPS
jgi:predicted nucleic acid-binding protein